MLNKNNKNAVVLLRDSKELVFPFSTVGCIQFIKHTIEIGVGAWTKTDLRTKIMATYGISGLAINEDKAQIGVYQMYFCEAKDVIKRYFPNCFTNEQFDKAEEYFTTKSMKVFNGRLPTIDIVWGAKIYGAYDMFCPINMRAVYGVGNRHYAFEDNTFNIECYYFDKKLSKFVRTCTECGAKYFDQNDVDCEGLDIPRGLIGIDGYCCECAEENGYVQCEDCGRLCEEDEAYWVENTSNYICENCYQSGEYSRCAECGRIFYTGDGDYVYSERVGEYFCDEDCAERYGLAYDEDRDDWVYEDECSSGILADYHSTYFAFVGLKPKTAKQYLGFGIEIEVCGDDPCVHRDFWVDTIKSKYLDDGTYGNVEHDGSVTAEIVTQPFTEKAFAKFDLEGMYDSLVNHGYTGHNNDCCGQHIHFSRGYLGYNNNQIMNSAKKVVAFFEDYWEDLVKISRRKESQLNWCKCYNTEITQDYPFDKLCYDRYRAVNLTNLFTNKRGTIEIRLPRGTLKASTTRATVDFFLHIVRNAKNISWKNIHNLKLWFKGIKDKNTIDYIKSRDAFVSEF